MRNVTAAVLVAVVWTAAPPSADAQWTVSMRAMHDPLPVGQCTAIELVVTDAGGRPPLRPDGRQLDWQDFELEFASPVPEAFAWSDQRHRFLCAGAAVPASATVVAHYPGSHLQPQERVPGMDVRQSIVLTNLMPAGHASAPPSYPQQPPVPTPQPTYAAQPAYPAQPTYAPQPAYAPQPVPPAPAAPPPPTAQAPAEAQPAPKGLGGLFKKIGAHAKQKVGEVTDQTTQNITTGATSVVDASLESGAGVVSSAALEATNSARSTVGDVGRSLTPEALRGGQSSDNLATVMAAGGGELRMLRFTGTTDVLEPASRELINRLAAALNQTHGTFVIEAHVDPLPSPAESQQLSEHRAAAVKQALIRSGVAANRLKALGYGASEPKPEIPPGGGPPSSARIVMVRETVANH
jgi:outer membrane protein OmpA-like peptidoglycan-associated protein